MAMGGGVFLWAGSGGGVAFVKNEPQFDTRAMAGTAVMFFGALFGAHSNTAQGSQSTYGTHELAVKQAAQSSSVWGSVRTPPGFIPRFVYSRPGDPPGNLPLVWGPQPATQGRITPLISSAPQVDLTPAPQVWRSATATVAVSANRLLTFTVTAPQADPTQIAPVIWKPIAGLSTNAAQGSNYTFGTHELAIKQGAQVSSVWPSVRTPPTTSGIIPQWLRAQPQIDQTPVQSQVWKSANNPGGWISLNVFAAPQDDPTQTKPQVFKSATAAVAVSAARLLPLVQTAPQFDTTQIQPQVFVSAPAAIVVSAQRLLPLVQTAPQTDPTQIAPRVWPSLRYVPYAIRTWITTAPQIDPTPIQPAVYQVGNVQPVITPQIPDSIRVLHVEFIGRLLIVGEPESPLEVEPPNQLRI